MDNIEELIRDSILKLHNNWRNIPEDSYSWTKAIKDELCKLGKKKKYEVYTGGSKKATAGEWMFDVSWLKAKGEFIKELVLVAESEWDPYGVLDDFQKLLVSRAKYRVMICWEKNYIKGQRLIKKLLKQIADFSGSETGDRYLLVCWIGDTYQLIIRSFVFK